MQTGNWSETEKISTENSAQDEETTLKFTAKQKLCSVVFILGPNNTDHALIFYIKLVQNITVTHPTYLRSQSLPLCASDSQITSIYHTTSSATGLSFAPHIWGEMWKWRVRSHPTLNLGEVPQWKIRVIQQVLPRRGGKPLSPSPSCPFHPGLLPSLRAERDACVSASASPFPPFFYMFFPQRKHREDKRALTTHSFISSIIYKKQVHPLKHPSIGETAWARSHTVTRSGTPFVVTSKSSVSEALLSLQHRHLGCPWN